MAPHYPQALHPNPGLYLQPHHPPPGTSSIIPIPWMLIRSPSPSLFHAYKTLSSSLTNSIISPGGNSPLTFPPSRSLMAADQPLLCDINPILLVCKRFFSCLSPFRGKAGLYSFWYHQPLDDACLNKHILNKLWRVRVEYLSQFSEFVLGYGGGDLFQIYKSFSVSHVYQI